MPFPEDKRNSNGFDKRPEDAKKATGRPVSIKRQLKELLLKNGELPIPANQFIRMETKNVNGKEQEFYIFKMATQQAMAAKLISMAMSRNTNGFRAIQLILEHFDGKPTQPIVTNERPSITIINKSGAEIDDKGFVK